MIPWASTVCHSTVDKIVVQWILTSVPSISKHRTLFVCNYIQAIYTKNCIITKNLATIIDSRRNKNGIFVESRKAWQYQEFPVKAPHNYGGLFKVQFFMYLLSL